MAGPPADWPVCVCTEPVSERIVGLWTVKAPARLVVAHVHHLQRVRLEPAGHACSGAQQHRPLPAQLKAEPQCSRLAAHQRPCLGSAGRADLMVHSRF